MACLTYSMLTIDDGYFGEQVWLPAEISLCDTCMRYYMHHFCRQIPYVTNARTRCMRTYFRTPAPSECPTGNLRANCMRITIHAINV